MCGMRVLKFANFVLFCIVLYSHGKVLKSLQNSQTLRRYILHILRYFATKLYYVSSIRYYFNGLTELHSIYNALSSCTSD